MKKIAIQISPEAKGAYFADYLHAAQQELTKVLGDISTTYTNIGPLEYFVVEDDGVNPHKLTQLSFTQGLYEMEGDLLRPLPLQADFRLHDDFVFGSKFKGKTNERLTQMLINVGLAEIGAAPGDNVKLLDPMCGRATTLLWAMRYGINGRGIEQDPNCITDIQRNLGKWTKIHRQKHKLPLGSTGGKEKKSSARFIDFNAEGCSMRVAVGDAREADQILNNEKFDLLVCDLPYGVQHATTKNTRNPLAVIRQCVEPWKKCLKKNGAVILAYNRNNPKRDALAAVFEQGGFETGSFSAAHRMSESIVRDVIIFRPTH